jgi:N-acetylglucosamine-6-phosphate deacetylase
MPGILYIGADVFDGAKTGPGGLLVEDGRVAALLRPGEPAPGAKVVDLGGGLVAPGFVDLQVNGGGGVMFNDAPDVATLRRMAEAHGRLGSVTILPTLITDTGRRVPPWRRWRGPWRRACPGSPACISKGRT